MTSSNSDTRLDGVLDGLTTEQCELLARWPHGEGFTYGGPNSFYGDVAPGHVAQSLVDIGYAIILPWKHGTQLGLSGLGLSAHLALTSAPPPSVSEEKES